MEFFRYPTLVHKCFGNHNCKFSCSLQIVEDLIINLIVIIYAGDLSLLLKLRKIVLVDFKSLSMRQWLHQVLKKR